MTIPCGTCRDPLEVIDHARDDPDREPDSLPRPETGSAGNRSAQNSSGQGGSVLAADRLGDPQPLRPEDDLFSSLGIDSVQALDLLSELERTFQVEIPDYELQDVRTFAELAERIADRV